MRPLQHSQGIFFFLASHFYKVKFTTDPVNYRWGHRHWFYALSPSSSPHSTPPSPPTPKHPPISLSNSLSWPRATGRPCLIRSADSPRPHPDLSSLEHVNLPATHTGTHICSRHTPQGSEGVSLAFTCAIGATNPRPQQKGGVFAYENHKEGADFSRGHT